MKLFECQHCGQLLYFENTRCESCERRLGYLPAHETVTALEPDGDRWRALVAPGGPIPVLRQLRARNLQLADRAKAAPRSICEACRHNRTIPDLNTPENLARWRKIELAKHRLFYTILKLRLPLVTRNEDADGLAFDFLSAGAQARTGRQRAVMTGHANGLITINLAEADDVEREQPAQRDGRALPHAARPLPARDRALLLGPADRQLAVHRGIPRHVRRRARRTTAQRCNGTTPTARPRTGTSGSSRPTPARIRGRTSPRPGRITCTWSIRWRPRARSD